MRGLQAPDRTKEQEAALCYEIGAAYEVKRMSKQALDYFQRTARLVPTFRDVQERIRRLQKVEPKQPAARRRRRRRRRVRPRLRRHPREQQASVGAVRAAPPGS